MRLRGAVHKLRVKAFNWEARRGAPTKSWRRDAPYILDLDLAFGPVIEKLRPDMVHANDIAMIGVVAQAVARMRARGERVRWLYDAHEYVQGVQWSTPIQASAYRMLERKFIHKSDAGDVTVSTQMADMLQRSYRLSTPPLVVGNAPVRGVDADNGDVPLREVCGLALEVPLIVYAGSIAPERGLDAVVKALPALPDVHLALVAGRTNTSLSALLDLSRRLGVHDRVHVAPYVAPHAVPTYLASATLGVIRFSASPITRSHSRPSCPSTCTRVFPSSCPM